MSEEEKKIEAAIENEYLKQIVEEIPDWMLKNSEPIPRNPDKFNEHSVIIINKLIKDLTKAKTSLWICRKRQDSS